MTGPLHSEGVRFFGTPLASARAAVVLVHGRGASAEGMAPLALALRAEGLAFAAPQAPGGAWYPLPFTAPVEHNEPHLSRSLGTITALFDALAARLPAEKIFLVGFSQGACLALEWAARRAAGWPRPEAGADPGQWFTPRAPGGGNGSRRKPAEDLTGAGELRQIGRLALFQAARQGTRPLGGVGALSGGLIGPPGGLPEYGGWLGGAPVFLGCAEQDGHIPKQRVEESAAIFRRMGAQVEMRLYPGAAHEVNDDEIEVLRVMLAGALL